MGKLPEILNDIFVFGSGSLPAVNYFLSEHSPHKAWKHFALVFKYIWSGNFSKALKHIDLALKFCKQDTVRYILLSEKLFLQSTFGKLDNETFSLLKKSISKLSQRSRDIVLCTLLNLEAKGLASMRSTRVWSLKYEKDIPEAAFVHINLARRFASQGKLSDAAHHFVKAYRIASSIPHPSGIVTALNGLAWTIRKRHTKFAYKFSRAAALYLGFFREDTGNLSGVLDTVLEIETTLKSPSIYKTAFVITSLSMPDRYKKLKERASQLVPSFSESIYKNTRKLRNFLKKIIGPYSKERLSPSRASEIVTGKTSFIRSHTLQKLLEGKEINIFSCPYPAYNELIKIRIKKDFEKAIMTLQDMNFEDRLRLFLSTFTALVDRSNFYLSRKDKFLTAFSLLKKKKDIPCFKDFMSKRYETMLFVIDMIDPHPYTKGRKEAAMRFFRKVSARRLERFASIYSQMQEDRRKGIDRFLRNYGRYEVMKLHTRLKGPQTVRDFAKMYGAKVKPAFAAYWAESDGRVKRKIERILMMFLTRI